jgi:hypothetical protein
MRTLIGFAWAIGLVTGAWAATEKSIPNGYCLNNQLVHGIPTGKFRPRAGQTFDVFLGEFTEKLRGHMGDQWEFTGQIYYPTVLRNRTVLTYKIDVPNETIHVFVTRIADARPIPQGKDWVVVGLTDRGQIRLSIPFSGTHLLRDHESQFSISEDGVVRPGIRYGANPERIARFTAEAQDLVKALSPADWTTPSEIRLSASKLNDREVMGVSVDYETGRVALYSSRVLTSPGSNLVSVTLPDGDTVFTPIIDPESGTELLVRRR